MVHAASVAYLRAQYFSASRSNTSFSTASVTQSVFPSASILKQAFEFPSWCAAKSLEMTTDDLMPVIEVKFSLKCQQNSILFNYLLYLK